MVKFDHEKVKTWTNGLIGWGGATGALLALGEVGHLGYLTINKTESHVFNVITTLSLLVFGLSIIFIYTNWSSSKLFKENQSYKLSNEKLKRSKLEKHYNSIIQCMHSITHESRCIAGTLRYDINQTDFSQFSTRDAQSREFFIHLLSNTREIFNRVTGHSCATSIKILMRDAQGNLNIKTYYRDPISYAERKRNDKKRQLQPFTSNTAIETILDEGNDFDFFFDNDLNSRAHYMNLNPDWKNFYNATIVVPIKHESSDVKESLPIGFLCVDSLEGQFDKKSYKILASISDICYFVMTTITEYKQAGDIAANE